MEAYLARLAESGIKRHQLLLTDAETARIKEIVSCWRNEQSTLDQDQLNACNLLKP
jgi:hypothetical protein